MQYILDAKSNTSSIQQRAIYRLEDLANAFYMTHNDGMGNELSDIAESLQACIGIMNDATNAQLGEDIRQAKESSANILRACLAGMEAERGSRED